ncbi:hypothetical protein bgla_1g27140 [Burkholderia gladioli BSR3]|uniref:Ribosomal RNA large subunit methyltransferase K/L-like methyltransferase domain-containing protein n=2 Tax=Burkholderia gladioli TaxID=28095 RepID=F2LA86_BURGS|nr:hypothetical protein bgla_1g27140 [Burkholderia gladioli BSR3]
MHASQRIPKASPVTQKKNVLSARVLDTSMLLERLLHDFGNTGNPVEVDFRALVDWLKMGDQQTHHMHPYPGKLLPHIAHFFCGASTLGGEVPTVLDPFCGSGTVALEGALAGWQPLVADANPLALLITKVKTKAYRVSALRTAMSDLMARARRYRTGPVVPIVNDVLWYDPRIKRDLERLLRAVDEVANDDTRDFFKVCFSVTARKLSFADPTVAVPVRMKAKPGLRPEALAQIESQLQRILVANVFDEFERVCEANVARVEEANRTNPTRSMAVPVGSDARQLLEPRKAGRRAMAEGSVPLIITSPPYGSAQKYVRATSLSLNWLGLAGPGDLRALEGASIGREHLRLSETVNSADGLPQAYLDLVTEIGEINADRGRITMTYLVEMRQALVEMVRVLAKKGKLVLVVGNNQVCGLPLRNDDFITQILESLGMRLELSLVDHIKSRGLMVKRNKTASVISRESVLMFGKY